MSTFGKRPPPGDRRRTPRKPVSVSGSILFGNVAPMKCSIVDLSATGAQVLVPSILGIPNEFQLRVGEAPARRVEVVRRGRSRLGVKFL